MQFGVSIFHANSISIPEKRGSRTDCLMPLHKPGNTHARAGEKRERKVMTEEKKSVVHSADGNVAPPCTDARRPDVKQSGGRERRAFLK